MPHLAQTSPHPNISICIPAYGRPDEFSLLLESLRLLTTPAYEILICEDGSPQRQLISELAQQFANNMRDVPTTVRYVNNDQNLGYDGNLRQLISLATGDYVFFIGNDDYVLPQAMKTASQFLQQHKVLAASRSFARFSTNPLQPVGYSRVYLTDQVITKDNANAGMVQRIGGFFGGLIFDRRWAESMATNEYDGTLYYQMYLLLNAYATGSIGYMCEPTVAARADNAPLFGSAQSEQDHFTPGRYSAQARGKMWESILRIAQDTERKTGVPISEAVQHELSGRMSFHVFEMFAGRGKDELKKLRLELKRLNLYGHWLPKCLYSINYILGKNSSYFYSLTRKVIQR
jgi:glycosyltransferase involved in cell wall biosynthesis